MASIQEENTALVRAFRTKVAAGGDTDALGIFLSEDAVDRQPVVDIRVDGETVCPTYWRALATPDIDITIDDVVAVDEKVAVRGILTRLLGESRQDRVPSGHSFEIVIVWFCRAENSQLVETWSLPCGLWLLRQFDEIPGGT